MFDGLRRSNHGYWDYHQNIGIKYYQVVNLVIENMSMSKSVDYVSLSSNALLENNARRYNHKTRLVK